MDEGFVPHPVAPAGAPAPARRLGGLRTRSAAMATAAGLLAGGLIGGYAIAHAATDSSTSTSTATSTPSVPANGTPPAGPGAPGGGPGGGSFDPTKGGHVGANGLVEKLLTGDTATRVRAAAQAAVPGGTIERVENDAEGSPYEAHMVKSDGTHVTVKVDSNFKVTNVETDGFGH